MSKLATCYLQVYESLCGKHPFMRPWHFQWLAGRDLYIDLRRVLKPIGGRILDVGCGDKPYSSWFGGDVQEYVGIDVYSGPKVDITIEPGKPWPLVDGQFDVVFSTQVLEHVAETSSVLGEIHRALKPGGTLVLSVPFIYNQHGAPHDYRRLSVFGVRQLFQDDYEILQVKSEGGVGSTVGLLILNWLIHSLGRNSATRLLKGVFLPVIILLSALVNGIGFVFDKLDRTDSYYSNVLLVAVKRG